jgi:putative ABC transport system substrate-binding protein
MLLSAASQRESRVSTIQLKERFNIPGELHQRPLEGGRALARLRVSLRGAIRQAGGMTGKVMSGAKPAELPIELTTNLEMVVNAKRPKVLASH